MTVIILILVGLLLVLLSWCWNSLENVEKNKKALYILIGVSLTTLVSLIIFNISKSGIQYKNEESLKYVRNILVFVTMIINGFIFLPVIFRTIGQIKNQNIEEQQIKKRTICIIILIIVISIIEINYLKSTQEGILNLVENLKQ